VFTLAGLFSLDAFGGGLVVQSVLALWLFKRFDLSLESAGSIFFWTGVFAAVSFLLAVPLAERFGLINTMVFTHLPSNVLLVLVPFVPTLPLANACLLARSALSQMDVPTRGSYVMTVVPPAERAAAASVTAVPRSLASALGPLPAGFLLALSPFGWPLVAAGVLSKASMTSCCSRCSRACVHLRKGSEDDDEYAKSCVGRSDRHSLEGRTRVRAHVGARSHRAWSAVRRIGRAWRCHGASGVCRRRNR